MGSASLVPTILTFAAIVGIGALLRATRLLSSDDAGPLNTVIIYVGLPAFVFQAVHGAALNVGVIGVIATSWIAFAVIIAAAYVVGRLLRLQPRTAGALMLTSSLGNTGYLGYPLTAALLGSAAVPTAVFSDVFGTVFALVLVGLPVAARFGTHSHGRPRVLKEVLSFPAVIALVVALVLRPVAVPDVVSGGLDLLASVVAPMIMLSVGLSLRPKAAMGAAGILAVVVVLRLMVSPAVAWGAGTLLLAPGQLLQVAVFQAGMPSMMLTYAVAERYGLDTDFVAAAIFVTTVGAAVTLPAVQALVL